MHGEDLGCQPVTAGTRGDDTQECTASEPNWKASDPIATLIARLESAAAQGGPVSLGGRIAVRVRAISVDFTVGRRP